jgi:hypothetical protein
MFCKPKSNARASVGGGVSSDFVPNRHSISLLRARKARELSGWGGSTENRNASLAGGKIPRYIDNAADSFAIVTPQVCIYG